MFKSLFGYRAKHIEKFLSQLFTINSVYDISMTSDKRVTSICQRYTDKYADLNVARINIRPFFKNQNEYILN